MSGLLLAGCSGPFSTLEPQGPAASAIAHLWWGMLLGATVLFALVMVAFYIAIWRPALGARLSAKRWIVLGGLALPAVVLPPLVLWALIAGERILPLPGQEVHRIEVEAYMFGWTFRYPDQDDLVTHEILHLPEGEPVDLHITARDVIHAVWIPQLGGKIDALPGHVNVLRLRADTAGTYHGQCAEFCGAGHARMRFLVEVHAAEDYSAALIEAADRPETEVEADADTPAAPEGNEYPQLEPEGQP